MSSKLLNLEQSLGLAPPEVYQQPWEKELLCDLRTFSRTGSKPAPVGGTYVESGFLAVPLLFGGQEPTGFIQTDHSFRAPATYAHPLRSLA